MSANRRPKLSTLSPKFSTVSQKVLHPACGKFLSHPVLWKAVDEPPPFPHTPVDQIFLDFPNDFFSYPQIFPLLLLLLQNNLFLFSRRLEYSIFFSILSGAPPPNPGLLFVRTKSNQKPHREGTLSMGSLPYETPPPRRTQRGQRPLWIPPSIDGTYPEFLRILPWGRLLRNKLRQPPKETSIPLTGRQPKHRYPQNCRSDVKTKFSGRVVSTLIQTDWANKRGPGCPRRFLVTFYR